MASGQAIIIIIVKVWVDMPKWTDEKKAKKTKWKM